MNKDQVTPMLEVGTEPLPTAKAALNAFSPFELQGLALKNRVVMPALTRMRATNPGLIPTALMATYYGQRASAGLIVTEGTWVSAQAIGAVHVPGLFTAEQVVGWREVTDAVHRQGGKIIAQLWHAGSVSHPTLQHGVPPGSASAVNPKLKAYTVAGGTDTETPREMSREEIRTVIDDFSSAARNAKEAGFDGVQIQAGFQYLFAQFLHSVLNVRTDVYGGSRENRARLLFDTLDAVLEAMDGKDVGLKVGPSSDEAGLMTANVETIPTFEYLLHKLNAYNLSHLLIMGTQTDVSATPISSLAGDGMFRLARHYFKGTLIANAGFDLDRANRIIGSGVADMVAFGRPYISNPDLLERFKHGLPLAPISETSNSYRSLNDGSDGYTSYPRAAV